MKTIKAAIIAGIVMATMTVQAQAGEGGLNGLLIGAGSGAIVGQAIGRDKEATLLGTAVGGIFGLMVGSEMDRDNYGRAYGYAPSAVFHPPPPVPSVVFSYSHNDRYQDDRRYYHKERRHHRPHQYCREIVTTQWYRGHYRDVTKTICSDRGGWGRGHWQHDRDRW